MLYRRRLKYFLFKFLRLNSTPHKIALGFALGSTLNFIPTFAIPFAVILAVLIRLNIPAAIIGDLAFKPLLPLLFYSNLKIGCLLKNTPVEYTMGMFTLKHFDLAGFKSLGSSFLLGMTINFLVFTIITYVVTFYVFKNYRPVLIRIVRNFKIGKRR